MSPTSRDTQLTEQHLPDAEGPGTGHPDTGRPEESLPPVGGYGTGGRDDGSHTEGGTPLHHTRVGRYVLLSRLGKGGMGEVFEAFDPELRRTVAIKVLHERQLPGESRDTRALRLMREAQAMARLSHPHVLTVHDVGTHQGRVFLAMAKVDGGTLRQWLKEAPRSFRQVLPVCLAMGRGLAAAHAAGLVHRDFKPDNVLLGGKGGVWVTDFGIAREAGDASEVPTLDALPSGEGEAPLTATGAMVGTPAYMAPEQYAGRPADARSDQFSFCISVYEALAGQRPFEEGTLRRMAVTLLDTARAKEGAIVERPELAPPPHPRVPGWVHRLLVRGLSVSPEARFPTMDALLDALSKDPSVARRKWLGGAAAVLGGVALAAGVAVTVAKPEPRAQPCTGASAQFARVWGPQQRGAVEKAFLGSGAPEGAEAFTRAAKALDAYATEWSTMHQQACEATRVTGAQPEAHLALRMACLDRRLRSVDALTAELSRADAALVKRSSETVALLRGVSGCADIEALSAPVPPPEDPAVRKKVEAVREELARAQALLDVGRYPQALPAAKAAAESARALKYRPLEAEALHVLGWAHARLSQTEESMKTWTEAMAAATAGRHDEVAVQVATDLVSGLSDDRNWYAEAHLWARQAHALLERLGNSPELEGRLANSEGVLAFRENNFELAATHYGRAAALRERTLGPTHLDVGKTLNNQGMVLARQGRAAEAIPLYQRALAIVEERLGSRHPLLANTLGNLGIAEMELGHHDKALAWLERAYALRKDTLGADHPQTLRLLNDMAMVHEAAGAADKALDLHRQALEGLRRTFGPESVEAIEALRALASAEERLGREEDALKHYKEGFALQVKALEPEDLALNTMEEDVGRLLLMHRKKPREALPLVRAALARKVRWMGAEHSGTIHTRTGLAMTLLALNKADTALKELEVAARLMAPLGWSDAEAAWTYYAHAQALWKVKPAERTQALALARKAEGGFTQQGSYGTKDLEDVRKWLASRERTARR